MEQHTQHGAESERTVAKESIFKGPRYSKRVLFDQVTLSPGIASQWSRTVCVQGVREKGDNSKLCSKLIAFLTLSAHPNCQFIPLFTNSAFFS